MFARPVGFLQVDVDGLWAVRACYGKAEEASYDQDPCWSEGVPLLRDEFKRAGAAAAFFLVGRDLRHPGKRREAAKLVAEGFEIGNHSYTHRIGLTRMNAVRLQTELERTAASLAELGIRRWGFRAPGYDVDGRIYTAAVTAGALYDASLLGTFLMPALRLADAWMARRWDPRKRQFGRLAHGLAPTEPYYPDGLRLHMRGTGAIAEVPVCTTPLVGLPLTAATLFSLGRTGVRVLFERLAARRRVVLLLLHAIDGVDCRQPIVFGDRTPKLGGFALSTGQKRARVRMIVEEFVRVFQVVRADDWILRNMPPRSTGSC